jgi:hypothetical protein
VPDLVEAFREVRHLILALYVNGTANEFSVVWPRGAMKDEHDAIIESFDAFSTPTEAEYAQQDVKYICDPRVWFYFDELRPGGWPPDIANL